MIHVLVGREPDRAALTDWLDDAVAGAPRVVLLSGDAGAGKTRLLEDLLALASARGVATAFGGSVEREGAPPFWPWRCLLDDLGAPDLLGATDVSDPAAERFVRFDAISSWIGDVATAASGLVVAIDDLHRSDVASMRLFSHLAHGLRDRPLLMVATHRSTRLDQLHPFPSLLAELTRLPSRRSLDLTGLGRGAVAELLGEKADLAVVDRVVELTAGNALYVTELARHLAGGRDLDEVPGTLRDVIGARVAARSPACIETLRAAAVVGRDFAAGVVAGAVHRPALDVLAHLDEAVAGGLIEPTREPGRFRFTHVVVRDVVEAEIPQLALAQVHRQVADAIASYEGTGDDQLGDIARHWEAAVVLGDEGTAAAWNERAAEAANRMLAWEEAARLYERAVHLSGPQVDPLALHRRLIGVARARLHSDETSIAIGRCVEAARVAAGAGRGDLVAESALVAEGRGGSGGPEIPALIAVAEQALAMVDLAEHTLRARLLGLLTALYFYVDPSRCPALSDAAAREAAEAGSPIATVAAARARQMVRFGPEHAAERLRLADVMGEAGRALGDPGITQWETLWRIDALLELGRVPEAVASLPALRLQTEAVGHPMSRWHLARSESVLASATGQWADARRFARAARDIYARQEGHAAAVALELAVEVTIGIHTGFPPDVLDDYDRLDLTRAPGYVSDVPTIGPMLPLIALGRRGEADRLYDRLAPVPRWQPPPFLWLPIHTLRLLAAVALGRLDDVPGLLERFEPARGFHVAGGGGPIAYHGCVELQIGVGELALRRWDEAVTALRHAVGEAKEVSTPALEVRAAVLLAEALHGRGLSGDEREAADLVSRYRRRAETYEMRPWIERLDALSTAVPEVHRSPLSGREVEVAALVAKGMTNRAIADSLYIAERTAQNHVQNILTKLALSNRTQIASWYRDERG